MKRLLILALVLMVVTSGCEIINTPAYATPNIYVNNTKSYYVGSNNSTGATAWGAGGLPAQPNVEWRLADGLDWDTTGAGVYRNYGSTVLATGLIDGHRPALAEGILAKDQSALTFNGTNDHLYANDATELNPVADDFGVLVWARWTSTTHDKEITGKYNETGNQRSWVIFTGENAWIGSFYVGLSDDGTSDVAHMKFYETTVAFNDGKWHQIGFTWISDVLVLYADGSSAAITKIRDGVISAIYSGTGLPRIGSYIGTSNFFAGDIAWESYWQGAGTPTGGQVSAIYAAMNPTGSAALAYPSIQSADYNSAANSNILIAAGTYQETVSITKAFASVTAVDNGYANRPVIFGSNLPASAGTTGLTVSALSKISYLDVRGFSTGTGVLADANSDGTLLHHMVVDSCLHGVDFDGSASSDSMVNCDIDGAGIALSTGFRATTSTVVALYVIDCIFVNTATALTKAALQSLIESYNDFYGNTLNYAGALDASDLLVNPLFGGGNDYRLMKTAPLLRSGISIREYGPIIGAYEIGIELDRPVRLPWSGYPWGQQMEIER